MTKIRCNRKTGKKWLLISISVLFLFNIPVAQEMNSTGSKRELLTELIRLNDKSIPGALSRQCTEKEDKFFLAVFNSDSVVSPMATSNLIEKLMCSYVSPESKYYHSDELVQRMTIAAGALLNLQHDDGTIDLLSTNFHSTPDLGFTIYPLALAYSIMQKNNHLNYGEFSSLYFTRGKIVHFCY